MKLSLDELEVESYALQVSESELSEVKGGTTWGCVDIGMAVVSLILGIVSTCQSSNKNSTVSTSGSGEIPSGSYEIRADSVIIYRPDGTIEKHYNPHYQGSYQGSY